MKRAFTWLFLAAIILIPIQTIAAPAPVIPTFSITGVDRDNTVTIKTSNFPAGDTFTVRMGAFGTKGVGGTVVGSQNSGGGGTFTATYTIPAGLHGSDRIAIRLQSPTSGYYSYNWFWNNDYPDGGGGAPPGPASWGYPPAGKNTIPNTNVTAVVTDTSFTVKGTNFTTNDSYKVLIGAFGTKGVGGTQVGTQATDGTGAFTATFNIPAAYHGDNKLAIRFQSSASGYFAYDWFVNDASAPSPGGGAVTPPNGPGTIPTFTITAVVKDTTVTIKGTNFIPNDTYTVRMGAFGTKGVGGTVAGTQNVDATGAFTATFNIPAGLAGSAKIAIRLVSPTTGYYSYNWFYNNTYP